VSLKRYEAQVLENDEAEALFEDHDGMKVMQQSQ